MEDSEIRIMLVELFYILHFKDEFVSEEEMQELVIQVKKHLKISRGDFEKELLEKART